VSALGAGECPRGQPKSIPSSRSYTKINVPISRIAAAIAADIAPRPTASARIVRFGVVSRMALSATASKIVREWDARRLSNSPEDDRVLENGATMAMTISARMNTGDTERVMPRQRR